MRDVIYFQKTGFHKTVVSALMFCISMQTSENLKYICIAEKMFEWKNVYR